MIPSTDPRNGFASPEGSDAFTIRDVPKDKTDLTRKIYTMRTISMVAIRLSDYRARRPGVLSVSPM